MIYLILLICCGQPQTKEELNESITKRNMTLQQDSKKKALEAKTFGKFSIWKFVESSEIPSSISIEEATQEQFNEIMDFFVDKESNDFVLYISDENDDVNLNEVNVEERMKSLYTLINKNTEFRASNQEYMEKINELLENWSKSNNFRFFDDKDRLNVGYFWFRLLLESIDETKDLKLMELSNKYLLKLTNDQIVMLSEYLISKISYHRSYNLLPIFCYYLFMNTDDLNGFSLICNKLKRHIEESFKQYPNNEFLQALGLKIECLELLSTKNLELEKLSYQKIIKMIPTSGIIENLLTSAFNEHKMLEDRIKLMEIINKLEEIRDKTRVEMAENIRSLLKSDPKLDNKEEVIRLFGNKIDLETYLKEYSENAYNGLVSIDVIELLLQKHTDPKIIKKIDDYIYKSDYVPEYAKRDLSEILRKFMPRDSN